MNNNLTPQQYKEIDDFFNDTISPKEFATEMRKLMDTALQMYLDNDKNIQFRATLKQSYYWHTTFLEVIDPVLELDK